MTLTNQLLRCYRAFRRTEVHWITKRNWKGPLQVISPNSSVHKQGQPGACYSGPCPYGFWRPPRMETTQPRRTTYASARSASQLSVSLSSDRTSCASLCAHYSSKLSPKRLCHLPISDFETHKVKMRSLHQTRLTTSMIPVSALPCYHRYSMHVLLQSQQKTH